MLGPDDLGDMGADLATIRRDRRASVAFRRKETTLPAQDVRIVRAGGLPHAATGQSITEYQQRVLIYGPPGLDVEEDDRVTIGGVLYRVRVIRPDRTLETVAEAMAVAGR